MSKLNDELMEIGDRKWRLRLRLIVSDRCITNHASVRDIRELVPEGVPCREWAKGDRISKAGARTREAAGMALEFYHGENRDVTDAIAAMLAQLRDSRLPEALSAFDVQLAITLKLYGDETPSCAVVSDAVAFLAAVGASIDVDLYVWGEPPSAIA